METKIKKLPSGETELTVELNAQEFDVYYKKVEIELINNFEMPGFRKGKAPKDIFNKEVNQSKIYQETATAIIEKTLGEALEKEKLEVLGTPKIEIKKISSGNPFIYQATFSVLPKVKIISLKKIEALRKKTEITEQEVEKVLKDIREKRKKEILKEKEACRGDKVEMDINMFFGNVPVENGQAQKVPYVLGGQSWLPDLEKHLLGVKRNEEKEFVVTYPVDHFDKKLAGRDVNFKIKIHGVYEIELPELNDELAKSLGAFKDLSDLREKIKINIIEEKRLKNEELLEIEILNQLVAKSEFEEIPEILLDEETHKMLHELEDSLVQQNLKFDDYLGHLKKSKEELEKELKPQAEKRVKTILIFRNIIQENKLLVAEEEIDQQIKMISNYYAGNKELEKTFKTPEYRNYLKNTLLNRKTIEFIKSQVKIKE